MSGDSSSAAPEAAEGVTLGGGEALRITELLELLAELPSTPGLVAEEARYRAAELSMALPDPVPQREPGLRQPPGPLSLEPMALTGLAALLDLLSGMPSTPPEVAQEAQVHADTVWRLLADAA